MSISWIVFAVFHVSGLYYFSLLITFIICIFSFIIYTLLSLKLSLKLIWFILFFGLSTILLLYLLSITNGELLDRYFFILQNLPTLLTNINTVTFDSTFYFKLLPYILLSVLPLDTLLLGSGSSYFSNLVVENVNILPYNLLLNRYFNNNLDVGRFALNSYIVCQILEIGFIGLFLIIYFLPKPTTFKLNNVFPFPGYEYINNSNISNTNALFLVFSVFFFLSSFFTIFGAVPLLYPYPWISLGFLYLVINIRKTNSLNSIIS